MAQSFTKPSRLPRDLSRMVSDIIAKHYDWEIEAESRYRWMLRDNDKLIITTDVEASGISDNFHLDTVSNKKLALYEEFRMSQRNLLNEINNNLKSTYEGKLGTYQIYNPKFLEFDVNYKGFPEDSEIDHADITVKTQLFFKIIDYRPPLKYPEVESEEYIRNKYPRFYEIINSPGFNLRAVEYSELMSAIKSMEPDFTFDNILSNREIIKDIQEMSPKLSSIFLRAAVKRSFNYLYESTKDLDVDYVYLIKNLNSKLRQLQQRGQNQFIDLLELIQHGEVSPENIRLAIRTKIPEIAYALLQTKSSLMTPNDLDKLDEIVRLSPLFSGEKSRAP